MRWGLSIFRRALIGVVAFALMLGAVAGFGAGQPFAAQRFFCARFVPNAEAQAQVQALARLIDPSLIGAGAQNKSDPDLSHDPCAWCLWAHIVLALPVDEGSSPAHGPRAPAFGAFTPYAWPMQAGPPIGSRAPPHAFL